MKNLPKTLLIENPVFINELRQSAFRHHLKITFTVWILIALFFGYLASYTILAGFLVWIPAGLSPLIIPALSAGAFSKEYEQQTWQDLYLTSLTNAQVVFGKFFAYLFQSVIFLTAFLPMYFFMYLQAYRSEMSGLQEVMIPIWMQLKMAFLTALLMSKLILSAVLYILLVMVCSRYSPNRRVSLIWSYIALAAYTAWGWLIFMFLGSLDGHEQLLSAIQEGLGRRPELLMRTFMNGIHLIFCSTVGIGSLILIWVSLSEQRGYKNGDDDGGVTRSWQPIVKRRV